MNATELERRQTRAETETFVIAKVAEGYRLCSPLNPAAQYVVTGAPDEPRCTCPDFERHASDRGWRCKHILAVLRQTEDQQLQAGNTVLTGNREDPTRTRERKSSPAPTPAPQMILKRSVSPDGRIDSLSVEFACPVGISSAEAVKACAEATLALQAEIVEQFLRRNNKPAAKPNGGPTDQPIEPDLGQPARITRIMGMDTRWGRRLYLAIQVNDQTLRYFGTDRQLALALAATGFPAASAQIAEGVTLDLPCRVVTKPSENGKYINVDRILPPERGNGG